MTGTSNSDKLEPLHGLSEIVRGRLGTNEDPAPNLSTEANSPTRNVGNFLKRVYLENIVSEDGNPKDYGKAEEYLSGFSEEVEKDVEEEHEDTGGHNEDIGVPYDNGIYEGDDDDDDSDELEVVNDDDDDDDNDDDEGDNDGEDDDEDENVIDDDGNAYDDYVRNTDASSYGSLAFRNLLQRGGETTESSLIDVMQRLVGGMGNSPFGRQLSEYDSLIDNLNQRDDIYLILETLNELLERLLMMNGITAERVISPNKLARALVDILKDPQLFDDLELHLVACRCLYNFVEVNQDFIHDALNSAAVEVLVHALLEITYIDLTEQALQTLEMISREPSSHSLIVTSNGLKACLQNLDFLTIHAQRKCLTIVANACTNVPIAHFNIVLEEFEKLAAVAENHTDGIVLENTWLAISRIVISYKMRPDFLERLFRNENILIQMASVIRSSCNPSSTDLGLKYQSNISLIKSLITVASSSVRISQLLLKIRIGLYIATSLGKFKRSDDQKVSTFPATLEVDSMGAENVTIEAFITAPNELLSHFLHLVGYLLPITYLPSETPFVDSGHKDHELRTGINKERVSLYQNECATEYATFVNDIWQVLIRSFQATMDYQIRKNVLINISRIIAFSDGDNFSKIRGIDELPSILTSIVTSGKKKMLESDPGNAKGLEQPLWSLRHDLLLLSAVSIALRILSNSDGSCVMLFEKEGFFDDLLTILSTLASLYPDIEAAKQELLTLANKDDDADQRLGVNLTSAYYNKYIDKEFTKDYEYRLSTQLTNKKLRLVCYKLEMYHEEIRNLNVSYDSLSGRLHEILEKLESLMRSNSNIDQWSAVWLRLKDLLSFLSNPISTFELVSLGMIQVICNVFSEEKSLLVSHDLPQILSFLQAFYEDRASLTRFVDLLQDSLTRCESFEIVSSGGNNANRSNHATAMMKQIKLKLVAAEDEDSAIPFKMQLLTLSVHSIATFKSIVSFLKQRFLVFDRIDKSAMNTYSFVEQEGNHYVDHGYDGDHDINDVEDDVDLDDISEDEPLKKEKGAFEIEFSINGSTIPTETTIYGAVYRAIQSKKRSAKVEPQEVWSKPHTITYRRVSSSIPKNTESQVTSFLNEWDAIEPITDSILKLLKLLFTFNQLMMDKSVVVLTPEKFMNWKLTVKLNRQLEEPLIIASGTLPNWSILLTKGYPFIFPLETRLFFLQSTSFGYSRLIHNWQIRGIQEQGDEQNGHALVNNQMGGLQLGRPLRRKVRISRKHILQSALKVLQLYGSSPGVLEIEYFDEVGSGLGPTLEFFSSVSMDFSKKSLYMWRDERVDDKNSEFVNSPNGLFPRPIDQLLIDSENGRKVLYLFSALGTFVARSLLDSRILDFSFNIFFLKLIHYANVNSFGGFSKSCEISRYLSFLREVDPQLASSINYLSQFLKSKDHSIDGVSLEDLSLTFVLPGYPKFELIPGGSDVAVGPENLRAYIEMVVEATVFKGVINQVKAFMQGFSRVFPISSLTIFSPNELRDMFGNSDEDWSKDTLVDAIRANHGYTRDSRAIHHLVNVLSGFSDAERRKFLQFLTGSPKLPIGGFKAITPEFTVVKKRPEDGLASDDYLPSVMTCANYLKLPDYSLEIAMREKLLHAITEGAGAFHLS